MRHRFVFGTCTALTAAALMAGCGGGQSRAAGGGSVPPATTATPATAAPTTAGTTSTTVAPAPATAAPAPSTTAPSSTTVAPATTPVMLIQAAGGQTRSYVRPTATYYSGDSSNIVDKLTWTSWGPTGAVGHGTWREESCVPDCASGSITAVPATLILGAPHSGHFTTMTERAGSLDRSYTYPARWALDAQ